VITVGAMKDMLTPNRADDQIASYSSKGPSLLDHVVKPDLVARVIVSSHWLWEELFKDRAALQIRSCVPITKNTA
jgi:hypothetical protein